MSIHDFDFADVNPMKWNQTFSPKTFEGLPEGDPVMPQRPLVGMENESRTDIFFERMNVDISQEVFEILPAGFKTMDRGIKNFFSNWPVPTRSGLRMMQVRLTGGDKPYLTWAQDLRRGRIFLPVMAIKRESSEFNPNKFSPEGHHMGRRYLGSDNSRVALVYRPVPALLNYTCSVWVEHKVDLETINYQFLRRFNPTAEFLVEDEHLKGSVFLRYEGTTYSSDDEVPPDQRQNKRADYRIIAEGWLPLPEKRVPTILGHVTSLREGVSTYGGNLLDTVVGRDVTPIWR